MSEQTEQKDISVSEETKSKKKVLPYLLLGIAAAAAAVVITLAVTKGSGTPEASGTGSAPKKQLSLDAGQQDFADQAAEAPKARNIVMPGWPAITIAADTTEITQGVDFYNPMKNKWYTCPDCGNDLDGEFFCAHCDKKVATGTQVEDCFYMTFALCLSENDEVLYQSGLVAPGKHLQNITLTRALPAGQYDAYVFIQPYKSDMATPCNNGVVKISLNAE